MSGVKLREQMPLTAKWIDERRAEYGKAFVDDLIRRAMKGEPDCFYAIEGGHILGAPFSEKAHDMAYWQRYAVVCGVRFAGFLRTPEGTLTHGTD